MNIFLDDERTPSQVTWINLPNVVWTIVRNYDDFVKLIETTNYIKHVSFDHDLADQHYGHGLNNDQIDYKQYTEKTGMHCAKALTDWCLTNNTPLPDYTVHSLNPVGRNNIICYLEYYKRFSVLS